MDCHSVIAAVPSHRRTIKMGDQAVPEGDMESAKLAT
jgi:hypothetical protein